MRYDVYGIGNALVDFLFFVDDTFLRQQGIAKGVMTLVDETAAEKLAQQAGGDVIMCSGGSAANTMVGLAVTGGSACYCGKVGRDNLGSFYRDDLSKLGIKLYGSAGDLPTGSCAALVSADGERSMLTHLGASTTLDQSDINEDAIKSSTYIYIEGYLWDSPSAREASIAAMDLAGKNGVRIAFSYSDPFLVNRFRDDFLNLSREYVDLLFCNEQEATQITGIDDPVAAATELGARVDQVCVTLGERGALVVNQKSMRQTPALPIIKAVDTTGAGDMYAAGVLRGLTLSLDLVSSSLLGARLAGSVVENIGARLTPDALNR